jgi:UDP-N-acetyl-D-mannosaminuronic acid dehydrogenase
VKLAVADYLHANLQKKRKDVVISCYGLAFKPNIDDLRENPALKIATQLASIHPGLVWAVEPNITNLSTLLCGRSLVDLDHSNSNANVHVLLVQHTQFLKLDLRDLNVVNAADIQRGAARRHELNQICKRHRPHQSEI